MSLVIDFRDSLHRHVERELPWYVNGTIEEPLRRRIEAHLAGCARCRQEATQLRRFRSRLIEEPEVGTPVPDFAALASRIEFRKDSPRPERAHRKPGDSRKLLWAVGLAQAAVLLLLLAPWSRAPQPAAYRTLGASRPAATPAGAALVLMMFRPETTLADARRLLQANGARIVEGPNSAGAYFVALPVDDPAKAIAGLRREPAVLLVERVDREAAR